MSWNDWVRGVEIEPSLYAADFSRLGQQIEVVMDAGAKIFQFDVGDGHFVEPITIGPIVLQSISGLVHRRGGVLDVHLMVEYPERDFHAAADVDLVLCMSIHPGYSGQELMPEALGRIRRLRELLPDSKLIQVDGGVGLENVAA